METLFDLFGALTLGEPPADEWDDAALERAWQGEEALWMAKLAGPVAERRAQVAAACALARRVERLLPAGDPRALRAIAAAERWLARPSDAPEALSSVAEQAYLAEIDATPQGFGCTSAVKVAFDPALVALGEGTLASTVLHAENAIANGEGAERRAAQAEIAVLLRAHIACPRLAALRGAAFDGE
ncbi:MAG: hypothetical protein U0234_06005 [Sandaracinus sp.]